LDGEGLNSSSSSSSVVHPASIVQRNPPRHPQWRLACPERPLRSAAAPNGAGQCAGGGASQGAWRSPSRRGDEAGGALGPCHGCHGAQPSGPCPKPTALATPLSYPVRAAAPRTVGGMPGGGNWNMPCHGRPLSLATLPHHHHLVVLFYILDRPRPGLETFLCPSTLSPFGLALRDLPSSSSLLLALCAATPHDTARLHAHQHPRTPDAHGLDHATACLTASSSQRETSPLHAVGGTAEGGCRFHSTPSAH